MLRMFLALALVALLGIAFLLWRRSSVARHGLASRTATWYQLVPKGRHETLLENLSGTAAGLVSSLTADSAVGIDGGVVVVRTGSLDKPVETYCCVWGSSNADSDQLAEGMARAVSSEARRMEEMPDLDLDGTWFEARRGVPSPAEATPGELANRHADAIVDRLSRSDDTVTTIIAAVPMSDRSQVRLRESVRGAEVEKGSENQAHSRIAARFLTVSRNKTIARELVVTGPSSLPGHRFKLSSRSINARPEGIASLLLALCLAAVAWGVQASYSLYLYGGWAVLAVLAGLFFTGMLVPARSALFFQLDRGYLLPRRPKPGIFRRLIELKDAIDGHSNDGSEQRKLGWNKGVIPLNDTQFACSFAPPFETAGFDAGYGTERETVVPERLLRPTAGASRMGHDRDGQYIWLSASERYNGVGIVGDAGAGKTVTLLDLWMADLVNRTEGSDGNFWLEVKGPGKQKAIDAAKSVGVEPTVVDLASSESVRLDLFGGDNPLRNAKRLVSAMVYSDPDGYGPDNVPVLEAAFYLAQTIPVSAFKASGLRCKNVMAVAGMLTGLGSTERRDALVAEIERHLDEEEPSESLLDAWNDWATSEERVRKYASSRSANRDHPLNSSRNKIKILLSYRSMWAPSQGRPSTSLERLIGQHAVTVLNVGPVSGGDEVDGQAHKIMQAIIMSLFSAEMLGTPSREAWYSSGRSTTLYCDELSEIAPPSDHSVKLIGDLRDKAREAGLRLVFALQRLSQLDERLQKVFDGFGCIVYMRQTSTEDARDMASMIDPDNPEEWTASDIRGLGIGKSIVKMRSAAGAEMPFTMQWPFWPEVSAKDLIAVPEGSDD